MPSDNPDPIAPGDSVAFPNDAPGIATVVTRQSDTEFVLNAVGTYLVFFSAAVAEAAQLVITLNGAEIPYTVVGRDSLGSQIVGTSIINTTVTDTVLTIDNPTQAAANLTLSDVTGSTLPNSAQLVILRLA